MGVTDFQELIAWQLVDELRREVIAFTNKPPASRDFRFCNQIRDAVSSACRNIAEGFGRFRPSENARFVEFARASLNEVQDGLIEAKEKKYLEQEHFDRLWQLSRRALAAITSYQTYLRNCARSGAQPWRKPNPGTAKT